VLAGGRFGPGSSGASISADIPSALAVRCGSPPPSPSRTSPSSTRNCAEYWVLDLQQDRLVVHRDPGEHGYGELTVHGRESMLRPQRLALEPLAVGELLDSI
jgi:hypothetical protein